MNKNTVFIHTNEEIVDNLYIYIHSIYILICSYMCLCVFVSICMNSQIPRKIVIRDNRQHESSI